MSPRRKLTAPAKSDVDIIVDYFSTADVTIADTVLGIATRILNGRKPKPVAPLVPDGSANKAPRATRTARPRAGLSATPPDAPDVRPLGE